MFRHVPVCWNGRRGGLKIRCQRWRVGSSPTTGTKKERIPTGFSPFWWPACGWRRSASLKFLGGNTQSPPKPAPCKTDLRFGFGLPRRTTSKQGREVMWRLKHRHIDRRPCFSFSVANPLRWALRRFRFGYRLARSVNREKTVNLLQARGFLRFYRRFKENRASKSEHDVKPLGEKRKP